ncbi:hypothetical protein CK203_097516 [Vitis vinifera]|uniref:Uncharacterized protein n=1 Tax=Vitis vinifera TaxID=29760 RepID=A0A438CWK4_VITVI|nr:hypothetical protein CK203_097516 [Vitis vinifera]
MGARVQPVEWCIKDGFVWVFSGVYIPSSRRERESLKAELEQSKGFEMILSVWAASLDVEDYTTKLCQGSCSFILASKLEVLKSNLKVWDREILGNVLVKKELALSQVGF